MTSPPAPPAEHFFTLRLPAEDYQRLQALSKQRERSKSAELRLALRAWLEQHENGDSA